MSEQSKYPWTEGPWFTNGFRHVMARSTMDHPLHCWPDCTGQVGEGKFDCDDPNCDVKDMCLDERDLPGMATVTYLKNPEGMSQGDQIVHPMVGANADLIALAPEMADAVLMYESANPNEADAMLMGLAAKLRKIIDEAKLLVQHIEAGEN